MRERPDYGQDAPYAVAILLLLAAIAFGTTVALLWCGVPRPVAILVIGLAVGTNLLFSAMALVWYSKVVKGRLRERLLDLVPWQGHETVLDVGCGRGLLLVGAARRLRAGKAIGVDIWRADLSGNRRDAALENARREGVAERVEVKDGDARRLPFPDASFDVIVSSLVLHNLRKRVERHLAVQELARVLRPGGHMALLDLRYTREYVEVLNDCGLNDVRRLPVGPLLSWLFPILTWGFVHFYCVVGRKPVR
jgi:SAM-dependent methyltransferase